MFNTPKSSDEDWFIYNSDEEMANYFIENYNSIVDRYLNTPMSSMGYLKDNQVGNEKTLMHLNISCISVGFQNYNEMISHLLKEWYENHIFVYSINKDTFRDNNIILRYGKASLHYDIIGCDSKARRRDIKLDMLLS